MQQVMRPYATAGVALVGATLIAVIPTAVPRSDVQTRAVQLVDAWSDLFTDTTTNLQSIAGGEDSSAITSLYNDVLTNPVGVIEAFTNLTPTVTSDLTASPGQISVELTPGLEYILGQLGADGAALEAINGVATQLEADPSNAFNILYEGTATVLNAYLNGADNVSLLDGLITIPVYNGILAPEQTASVDLNLSDLLNALGLGNLGLGNLDLSSLLSQLGLGNLTLGGLVSDLTYNGSPLSDVGLGTLLQNDGVTSTSELLTLFGLGSLSNETLITALTSSGLLNGLDSAVVQALGTALGGTTVGTLLDDGSAGFTTLLNGDAPNFGQLLTDFGLSKLPLDLDGLGSLSNLTLADLLGDLGNVADISVSPLGGLITELVDTVPQQIVASLGG